MYVGDFVGEAAPYLQLSGSEFADVMALTQMTPGPIAVNCATFFGYRMGMDSFGAPAAALLCAFVATLALLIPGSTLLYIALGSIERFFGILIEHYAGAFPLWLAPEQVRVLPITDKQLDYANKIRAALRAAGYRCDVDVSAEKLGAKIRGGTMMKVPYMVIVGGKDEAAGVISVRSRTEGDKGQMTIEDFISKLDAEKEG
jgi:hypothetical protein